jgi:plastocyanin
MTKSSLRLLLGVFLASTIGFTGCRDDGNPPVGGSGGTSGTGGKGGGSGGKGGSAAGGKGGSAAGGSPAGGAGGTAAGGMDGGELDGSDADDGGDGTTDAATDVPVTPIDGAPDLGTGPDVAPAVVNGCTKFEDESGPNSDAYINWKNPLAAKEKCIQIKVGQEVVFGTTDFSVHPLSPAGGDAGNPIQPQTDGTADYKLTFPSVGVFGFKCNVHPVMTGAIKVVP